MLQQTFLFHFVWSLQQEAMKKTCKNVTNMSLLLLCK